MSDLAYSTDMESRRNILCVIGTRPEAVKMAPVVRALRAHPAGFAVTVVATAQHRAMLDRVLANFAIRPDIDLDMMTDNQSQPELIARLLPAFDQVLAATKPDFVLAQGDTTTVLAAALACFYRRVRFGHIEAGLRTHDMARPFPEEMNRTLVARLATRHYTPTESAAANLRAEGVPANAIVVTGNTVIDALHHMVARAPALPFRVAPERRVVLVTAHRRENFGAPFEQILAALARLVAAHPDIEIVYPVHPNPNVREPAHRILGHLDRVRLIEPLDYAGFVAAMVRSHLIISDSGGVQEEAPALGKPVLVLREVTERPEAVAAGVVRVVGVETEAIVREAGRLLIDPAAYAAMAKGVSPYGDGKAADRIAASLARDLAR
jgi:UDP-N-acetylglucosamine 2-epimerase (non-hydrolysing)